MRHNYSPNAPHSRSKHTSPATRTYSPPHSNFRKHRSDKFEKAQCFACKQFGHTVTHCRLLPKVLAIMQFKSKYNDKCDTILRQHIRTNTVDSKQVFVRTLQNMNILSQDDDSDSYLQNNMIVHTLIDNGIDNNDFQSDEE